MNRIYQGKVSNVEISTPHILSASIPFSASDGEKVAKPDEVNATHSQPCRAVAGEGGSTKP
jgi:hypothetical protein